MLEEFGFGKDIVEGKIEGKELPNEAGAKYNELPSEIGKSKTKELPSEVKSYNGKELSRESSDLYSKELPDEVDEREYDDLPEEVNKSRTKELPDEVSKEDDERADEKIEDNLNHERRDVNEEPQVVKNKREGCERENNVEKELRDQYPESEGFEILKEVYLKDKDGNYVIDPETGKRRRIDFVVVKDGKVIKSVEVTSLTAPKEEQMAKEQRIRDAGGNFVFDKEGNGYEFPEDLKTEIERRP